NSGAIQVTSLLTGTYWAEVTPLGGSRHLITAHGLAGTDQRNLEMTVQGEGQSIFQLPLFGDEEVRVKKDGLTDSYDSRLGPYDPETAGQRGHVGTNATDEDSVVLEQGTSINGQVVVGPGMADPSEAVSADGSVVITGDPPIVSAPQAVDTPPVDTTGLSCDQDLLLPKDATFTFAESDSPYCYDDIKADQNSVIAVTGNVVVYANRVDFDKHLQVNAGGKPTQLILQVTSDGDVVIDKEGTFVGAIYAPQSRVRLKKEVAFYGAIAAEQIEIDKKSAFHYDEALGDASGPIGSYEVSVLSWREL
ncbi:MAG: hypothetical protein HY599_03945, partial [Candidatus Omnitrophica bacterium]|nr:hypothetical protein [Candidatus Omnitrophota bacterium]